MYRKTFYATHPESIYGARNDELRELYLVGDLFAEGELRLNYSHFDRIVIGGASPVSEKSHCPRRPNRNRRQASLFWKGASSA